MAKYFTLTFLFLTLQNFAIAQTDKLPLAFSETYEYLEENGQQIQKTTVIDLTRDQPVEIRIWTIESGTNELKRTQKLGIVNGDTLTEVNLRQFDDSGNLVLEIDSSNNRLSNRTEFEYENKKLIEKKRLGYDWYQPDDSYYMKPTSSTTTFIYDGERLIKEMETEKGGLFSSDEIIYSTLYSYNENDLLEIEYYLKGADTLHVTKHTYDQNGNKKTSVSDDSTNTWKYDEQGNLIEEFIQMYNLTLRHIYTYNSSNQLVRKETYLKQ